jgi:cytochrome c553
MAATGSQFVTRSRIVAFAAGMLWLAARNVLADGTGFFSSAQLSQGRWEYSQKCSVCHGAQLQGGGAPALKGSEFSALWNGKTLKDFYDYVQANMPLGQGAALKGQEYADIVAYVLAQVGVPAGNEKLTPTTPMDRVLDLSAAPTAGGAAVDASSGEVKIGELYGTLSQPTTNRPTQGELDAADASTSDWLMFNKGYRGERFSTLRRINAGNAGKLKPVCMFQLGELGTFSTGPVVYDGILYATTHLGTYAIDATTCKKVWSHQHVAQGPEMNATNKGVAIAGGRVFRGTQDG